jgi:hypothetical protein
VIDGLIWIGKTSEHQKSSEKINLMNWECNKIGI